MALCAPFPLKIPTLKKIQEGPKLPVKPDTLPDCYLGRLEPLKPHKRESPLKFCENYQSYSQLNIFPVIFGMAFWAPFPLKTPTLKKIQEGPKLLLKPDSLPDCYLGRLEPLKTHKRKVTENPKK